MVAKVSKGLIPPPFAISCNCICKERATKVMKFYLDKKFKVTGGISKSPPTGGGGMNTADEVYAVVRNS